MHSRLRTRSTRPRSRRSLAERGQASIMIGVMMSTFLFFFAFVVNTGMLVNAKINLQNAADMAAYAGAAVQARQLTQISYLNYEMRRQYKKFLFRYYVVGNYSQANFPRTGGGGTAKTPMLWSPDGSPNKNYGVPAVCVPVKNPKDNVCQLPNLPEIIRPSVSVTDPITQTLKSYLDQLETIRTNNCASQGALNVQILHLWLWNTDPDYSLTLAGNSGASQQAKEDVAILRSVAMGMGLIPREILLRSRIKTLETYLNAPPERALTVDRINQLKDPGHLPEPPQSERAIQAFLSAFYTLGNHSFADTTAIQLDELVPAQTVKLSDITAKFDTYAVNFEKLGNACEPRFVVDALQNPIPLGVYKDPTVQTYYAVRLQAKARLLFNPFGGELTLRAYAAAKPFGSRIGPQLTESHFVRKGARINLLSANSAQDLTNQVPNLPIREEEFGAGAATGTGWDTREAMGAMYNTLSSGAASFTVNEFTLAKAYHAAMAPNRGEAPRYNIPHDAGDPFVRNFDTQKVLAFWAPVFPLSKLGQAQSELESLLTQYFKGGNGTQTSMLPAMKKGLNDYVSKLSAGQGEQIDLLPAQPGVTVQHAEGFRIARITDPIHPRPFAGSGSPPIIQVGGFTLNQSKEIRTSWNDVNSGDFENAGRVGYSVKFVSFDTLMGGGSGTNRIPLDDPELESDLAKIQH